MNVAFLLSFLSLSLGFVRAAKNVVNGEQYMHKVTDRMLELLSIETSISDDGLPMLDMKANFSGVTSFETKLDGIVNFHSGFVMRIEKFDLSAGKYEDKTDQTKVYIKTILGFDNVNVTYELDCELEEYKETTSMVIWFDRLEFTMEISKNHSSEDITTAITFFNIAGGSFSLYIFNFPDNAYTQLIGKAIKTAGSPTKLQDQLKESFRNWNNLGKFAEQACQEIDFPEICFTCI